MSRKAFLLTLGKGHMERLIAHVLEPDFPQAEYPVIWNIARTRYRDNINSWKSHTLFAIKAKILQYEASGKLPSTATALARLHITFKSHYTPEDFETIFSWCKDHIWLEKSDKTVKFWARRSGLRCSLQSRDILIGTGEFLILPVRLHWGRGSTGSSSSDTGIVSGLQTSTRSSESSTSTW